MQSKKSHIIRNLCILLSFWSLSAYAPAQTTVYPVQAYTQLIPPYTPYAPSYYSGGVEKMRVTLINADMMQPLLEVYLKMKITSSVFSLQTPEEVRTPPITLPAGVPVLLSRSDLEPYFRRENLQVSGGQAQFYRTLMLPDNFYRFHFEVYEVNTGRLLSNTRVGFAQALIAAGDPPILNLPLKSSVVEESNIPSIMFTWTPRHLNSVASAYGTEYEISLVEIHDKQTSAENAFQYSRVLHSERTRSTAFIYNSAHPLLQPGLRYAWRVQAVAREGLEEAQVFKNNGYSEIFWFDYKGNCPVVASSGVVIKGTEAAVSWQPAQAIGYTLEYRKKGGARWYGANVSGTSGTLYSLQWGETYEYRIGSRCYPDDLWDYSTIKAFTMPELPEKNPNCGILPDDNVSNRTPVSELTPGLPVFAGDFPVFITEVHGNGVFSGTGYIGIPFTRLPRITVTFSNITVNTDHRLIGGFFETKYDIKNKNLLWDVDQTLTGGAGVGDIRTGEERAQFVVDYTINPDIRIKPVTTDGSPDEIKEGDNYVFTRNENGKYTFIITDSEGKEHKVETENLPVTIEDKSGNTYEVNEKGEIKPVSTASGIKLDDRAKNTPHPDIATLIFEATPNTKYALDQYQEIYSKVTEYYQKYKMPDENMVASAKFMAPGASDEIFVKVKTAGNDFKPEKVHFVTGAGKEYKGVYDASKQGWTVTVLGSEAGDGQNLYVVQEESQGKYATLARLNIYSYERKSVNIKLVPVNGFTNNFNVNALSTELNKIYGKVGVTCNLSMAETGFTYTPVNGNSFDVTGSGLFSTETADMKAIKQAYNIYLDGNIDSNTLYLFIIEKAAGADGMAGDMPRGKRFGYLFPGADVRTIAHETGHGAFNLEHPFDRPLRGQFEKGQLAHCLMDYTSGTEFCKLEWDAINAPGLVIGILETDAGGQLAIFGGITWLGDIFGGLAPDNQEKEIEKAQTLFDHVYDNYSNYFEKSKTSDTNISDSKYTQWSIRNFSHQNKVCKALYAKLVQNEAPAFNLYENGIFIEKYKLEDKEYNVAVYSFAKDILLPRNDVKLTGYKDLADNKKVKAGYTKKYGFIVFYNEAKQPIMLVQIAGNNPEEDTKQWLNYLAIVIKSEAQTKKDESIWDKIKSLFIHTKEELPGVWGDGETEEIFLKDVQWVSQFDESLFGDCMGCWKNACCNRACVYMLGFTNTANCDDSQIAKNNPIHSVENIITAKFDNDTNWETLYDSKSIILNEKEKLDEAISYMKDEIQKKKRPIVIGVHYTNRGNKKPVGNTNKATYHFMVVVGYGKDAKGEYFRFYDPGREVEYETSATSENNRLYIQENFIKGSYNNKTYTITQINKYF